MLRKSSTSKDSDYSTGASHVLEVAIRLFLYAIIAWVNVSIFQGAYFTRLHITWNVQTTLHNKNTPVAVI